MESPLNLEMARANQSEQEKAKDSYRSRLNKTIQSIEKDLTTYNESLTNGEFEDKEGEEEGMGEQRKLSFQERITKTTQRAEKMKAMLDSGKDIPLTQEEISAEYTYINPKTGKVERQETITLNIEEKLQSFIDLYQKTNLDLPTDFEDVAREIWANNLAEIEAAIEEKGFNEMLIIPATDSLADLSLKMKMENGYYEGIKSDSTKSDLKGVPLTSAGTDLPRIILVHNAQNLANRPELKATKGIKAQDTNIEESLSLEDYIIFQRKYFEETGEHLDEDGWTWTPRTKSSTRFVASDWSSGGRLDVHALDPDDSSSDLGGRPSRYFV